MSHVVRMTGLSLVAAVSALGASQAVMAFGPQPRAAVSASSAQGAAQADSAHPTIPKSRDGHFWALGEVNGAPVRFLVDTGASTVALTIADARRLGFETGRLTYGYTVTTANGPARAAAVKLGRVSVGGAALDDVDALVIEEGLEASLLGMSYLGRLSRFEATPTALVLRP